MIALVLSALVTLVYPTSTVVTDELFSEACVQGTQPSSTVRPPFPGVAAGTDHARILDVLHCEIVAGNVREITFLDGGGAVALLTTGERIGFVVPSGRGAWFSSTAVEHDVTVHAARTVTIADGVVVEADDPGTSPLGVATLVVVVLLAAAWVVWWWRNRRRGVPAALGGTRRRGVSHDVPTTRFDDVAGCKEAIEDLKEIVDCLQDPSAYETIGARVPRGALLVGPPGTGKTLLARAVAGESGVPFFPVAGSDFVEMYVGVGAKRVREVFAKARRHGRAIVFIDEIDAVGRRRSENVATGGEQELENTLIALLNELDGFTQTGVVVLAATNRPDVLDPALLRPGRLDRRIHVGLPDRTERAAILAVHSRDKRIEAGVDFEEVAARSAGMSGAQLEQVCNEAALLAARERSTLISSQHFVAALEYVVAGRPRRSATIVAADRSVTAWHEAGHLVAALRQPGADRPAGASITPRGQAGGVTWTVPTDRMIVGRKDLLARLVVALAGRAAEEIVLGDEYTAGASDDLARASDLARTMVDRLGMTSRGLSVRHPGSKGSDDAVEELLQEAMTGARELLSSNSELLRTVVDALLEHSDLDVDAISALDAQHPAAPVGEGAGR
jgi:cell division protease FtsH